MTHKIDVIPFNLTLLCPNSNVCYGTNCAHLHQERTEQPKDWNFQMIIFQVDYDEIEVQWNQDDFFFRSGVQNKYNLPSLVVCKEKKRNVTSFVNKEKGEGKV